MQCVLHNDVGVIDVSVSLLITNILITDASLLSCLSLYCVISIRFFLQLVDETNTFHSNWLYPDVLMFF